jgi:PAS domain S-box-containing protein
MNHTDVENLLTHLCDEFIARLPERQSELNAQWEALLRREPAARAALHRAAHSLVGAAGVHRLIHISDAARSVEQIAGAWPTDLTPSAEQLNTLNSAMDRLFQAIENPHTPCVSSAPLRTLSAPRILVVDDDADQAHWLHSVLKSVGYQVEVFHELGTFASACQNTSPPNAVIMDMVFPQGEEAGAQTIANLKAQGLKDTPIIFLSGRRDLASRLAAYRAGASSYLTKPIDTDSLLQVMAETVALAPAQPYRVLLVDDDKDQLSAYALLLRQAGMTVRETDNPLQVPDILDDFAAEVLVLDMYMPACSGPELATALRDDKCHAGKPIVYLSAETDISRHLQALGRGGNHFLTKPVQPQHLVSVVALHARRFRQAQEQAAILQASVYEKERHQQAVNAHAIVSVADASGNVVYVNDRFCQISGYSRDELLGYNHRILKSGDHTPEFFDDMWRTISSGHIWSGEVCNRRKDGSLYWVDSSVVPFVDATGLPYQYISIRTDVTAHKQQLQALQESETRFRSAFDNSAIGMSLVSLDGRRLRVNRALCVMLDATEAELLGSSIQSNTHPDDIATDLALMDQLLRKECTSRQVEKRYITPNGQIVRALLDIALVENDLGHPLYFVAQLQNITQRKQAEEALAESQNRFSFAVEGAGDGIWDWNILTGDLQRTGHYEIMLGYEKGELAPHVDVWVASVHPDDLPGALENLQKNLTGTESNYAGELRLRCKDGSYKWVLCRGTVMAHDKAGHPVRMIGIHSDISAKKQMEEKLTQQKQLLDMLHRATTSFVAKADFTEAMNDMLATLLELTNSEYGFVGEVLYDESGSPYLKTHAITNIAWNAETQAQFAAVQDNGFEFRNLNTLFGHVMTSREVVVSNAPASDPRAGGLPPGHPALHCFLGVPILRGDELLGMYGIANHPSGYTDELQEFLRPFNATYGALIHSKRMTDSEQSNRAALIEAKDTAERATQAKSAFLSSMSHELRTPMNAIIGFAQVLEYDDDLTADQQDSVHEILKGGHHLLALINEVLNLAKIEAGHIDLSLEPIALLALAEDCQQLIGPLASQRNITIELLLDPGMLVHADRTRLKQVLLNLLSNAVKYNRNGGAIKIHATPVAEDCLRISVSDTGPGIATGQLGDLFQPFSRLGAEYSGIEGTGIGLTITRQLVELMGGQVGVSSEVGRGSTFWIELPFARTEAAHDNGPETHDKEDTVPPMPQHRLLCIDDNPVNLKLITQMLSRRKSIQLLTAHTPELGIELALAYQPDLILLDINMPGMNGYQVMEIFKTEARLKSTPVIAITANAMPRDVARGLAAGFSHYLTKPLDLGTFLHTVDQCLSVSKDTAT